VLFQRCYAEFGYHAFSVGFTTSGPNAFVQCYSFMPHNFSGAIGGWSAGVLFDIMTIDGGSISLAYRDVDGQGGGWSAANSLCWRCRAAQIHLPAPPGAQNCAYASWAQGYGDGHHELQHTFVKPESFYYAQLEARTGKKSPEEEKILVIESKETTAPFYEQPFSRSGEGEAFDRLSKYDLTKWNTWYWLRLRQFADLADQKGLIFTQEHYLQHNIIEEGAHWVDYPWRSDNNVNDPGFAENPHYAGDKRVYMAVEFYDTTNLVRKAFHRAYIRKSLDNFKGNTNIIHHLGNEYTGPLHFVQFWLDVIAGWEKENQTKLLVMLPGTKDVQDAVLSDPKRAAMVNIVDVIQWHNRKDGSLYAPPGGVSLAGRQYARIYEVGETSFAQIYRAVSELHLMYPDKAIVYNSQGTTLSDWAVFMAGGSLTSIPLIRDGGFLKAAAKMSPLVVNHRDTQQYVLGKRGVGYILFSKNQKVKFDLAGDTTVYPLKWINPVTGDVFPDNAFVTGGLGTSLSAPFQGSSVAWLCK
jgi:hypothetical protein